MKSLRDQVHALTESNSQLAQEGVILDKGIRDHCNKQELLTGPAGATRQGPSNPEGTVTMSMTDYEALKAKAKEESRHSTPIKKDLDPRQDIFSGTYDSDEDEGLEKGEEVLTNIQQWMADPDRGE